MSYALAMAVGAGIAAIGLYERCRRPRDSAVEARREQKVIHITDFTVQGAQVLASTRQITLAEFERVATVQQLNELRCGPGSGWGERTKQVWEQFLGRADRIVCAREGTRLVGFGCLMGKGREGDIFSLHIDSRYSTTKLPGLITKHLVD